MLAHRYYKASGLECSRDSAESSLIPHPSSLITPPSSLIPHPSSLIPHPCFFHMDYRPLGKSGIKVSAIGLGCNNFGLRADLAQTKAVVDKAIQLGTTLVDPAEADA